MNAKKLYVLTTKPLDPKERDVDGRELLNGVSYPNEPLTGVLITEEAEKHYDLVLEWCERHEKIPTEIVRDGAEALAFVLNYKSMEPWKQTIFAFLTREPLAELEALCSLARDSRIKTELRVRYNGF